MTSSSLSGGGEGPIPTMRPRVQDLDIMEFGADILRASTIVSKKMGVTSIIIILFGAEGSLGGSLIVTIIVSAGKLVGKTLRFWKV